MSKYNEVSNTLVSTPQKSSRQAASPPLDTIVNNAVQLAKEIDLERLESAKNRRYKLYSLRRLIGDNLKRVRPCGRYVRNTLEGVEVAKSKNNSVFYGGLQTCASVWSCPVCSLKISQRRSEEVKTMLENAIVRDQNKGLFITLTLPHTRTEDLKYLQKSVSDAWQELTADVRYKGRYRTKNKQSYLAEEGLKQRFGVLGFIRALEVKHGSNGWHPHLHICFVLEGHKYAHMQLFSEELIQLWTAIINKNTGKVARRRAQRSVEIYDVSGIADYATKWDLAKELVEGHKKEKGSGLTPFQLMEDYSKTQDEKQLNHFLAYSLAFHRVKQLTFSKGFKKKYLPTVSKTDEEICATESIEQVLLKLDAPLFKALHAFKEEANLLNLVQHAPAQIYDFLKGLLDVDLVPGEVPFYRLL